jgi:myo-inositol-1(or 4)-monophosphatase
MAGSANLNVMMKTARKVGRALVRDFGEVEQLQVSTKGPGDFVSRADRQAEKSIREALMEARPSYGFVGEEDGEIAGGDPTRRWIVDPLDGTTNFLHGMPHFSISIALKHRGRLEQAVIYDPLREELFTATRGRGALLNDRRIRVGDRVDLNGALLGTGIPFRDTQDLDRYLRTLRALIPDTAGVRRPGSAALDLAYVAAGRFDGFWEMGLRDWDIAAGLLLVQEAGGLVSDMEGQPDVFRRGDVVAGNPKILKAMLQRLRAALGPAES